MSAGDAKLVRMANAIAAFFEAYPEPEAVAGIHDHMVAFWTPKMRDALSREAEGPLGSTLHPLVRAAVRNLSTALSPAHAEAEGPALRGEVGSSDAG